MQKLVALAHCLCFIPANCTQNCKSTKILVCKIPFLPVYYRHKLVLLSENETIVRCFNCANNIPTQQGQLQLIPRIPAGKGSAHCLLDCVKRLVETVGLDPKGEKIVPQKVLPFHSACTYHKLNVEFRLKYFMDFLFSRLPPAILCQKESKSNYCGISFGRMPQRSECDRQRRQDTSRFDQRPSDHKAPLETRSQGCQCLQGTQQAHRKALLRATPTPSSVCAHHWRRWRGEEHSVEVHSEFKRVFVSIQEGKTCRWRRCEDSGDHTV